jgi:hypothetical protein
VFKPEQRWAFVLRLQNQARAWRVQLTDVQTGQQLEFDSLEACFGHLNRLQMEALETRKSNAD